MQTMRKEAHPAGCRAYMAEPPMHDANTPSGVPEQPQDSSQNPQAAAKDTVTRDSQSLGGATPGTPPAVTGSVDAGLSGQHAAERAVADAQVAAEKATQVASQVTSPEIPDLANLPAAQGADAIGMLDDVELEVRIELGRTRMLVEDVLRLSSDAVVELDKAAGDPVDIYVNGRRIARGEVLVLNENFCIRVSEIVEPQTRTG